MEDIAPSETSQTATPQVRKLYFKKELASNKLRLKDGSPAPFETVENDIGLLIVDDTDPIVQQLEDCIKRRCGGVIKITAEQYEELKKKPALKRSDSRSAAPKLFRPDNSNPFAPRFPTKLDPTVPTAPVLGSAVPAVDSNPAVVVAEPGEPKPFKPATAKVKKK